MHSEKEVNLAGFIVQVIINAIEHYKYFINFCSSFLSDAVVSVTISKLSGQ